MESLGTFSFPIRTRDKGPSWSGGHDDFFDDYVHADKFQEQEQEEWQDTGTSTSTFEELFEGLEDSASHRTHSSATSELRLLIEPHPTLPKKAPVEAVHATASAILQTRPRDIYARDLSVYEQSARGGLLDTYSFPSPPPELSSPTRIEKSRGRTRPGAQQESVKRTRNPSGVRKSLRHAKSTPNMMNPSRYRPGFEDTLVEQFALAPPVPNMDKKWHFRHPPSPPTSTETSDGHTWASMQNFQSPSRSQEVPVQHTDDFMNHFLSPAETFYSPQTSPVANAFPMDTAAFHQPFQDTGSHTTHDPQYGHQESPRQRRRSLTSFGNDTPPPLSNPWARANATPPSLHLNLTALRNVPPQTIMSAPLMKPDHARFGSYDPFNQTICPLSPFNNTSVSPSASAFPPAPAVNFSLPYWAQRSQNPAQTHASHRGQQVQHARTRSEAPTQKSSDLASRRTRSSSRARTTRQHRRTKSGPGPESSTPRVRGTRKGQGQVGFVNFTPDDSQKLLTGVAPSGSSKTKARREKEAQEKRRKLSQAAVEAVMNGDLSALREAGLEVEEEE